MAIAVDVLLGEWAKFAGLHFAIPAQLAAGKTCVHC